MDAAYRRYLKTLRIWFDSVPVGEWEHFYRDYLEFEGSLVFGDGISLRYNFPFYLEMMDDRSINHRPLLYHED